MRISGNGAVSLSFQQNNESRRSRLSGVNVWDHVLTVDQVYRLSLGCGNETANLLQWIDLKSYAPAEHVSKLRGLSCTYRDGKLNHLLLVIRALIPQIKHSTLLFAVFS